MVWILGIIIYLLIGLGLMVFIAMSDPWGGLVFEIWYLFIPLYPLFALFSLYHSIKK